jgi:hypothetical protein
VEDRAFADPDCLSALEAAEADLIDAYVRGELPPADRRGFERRFLTSPRRRNKVEFARAFATVTAEAGFLAPPARERASIWQALLGGGRGWVLGLRFAGALAALLCVAGASWLVFENASMRSRVAGLTQALSQAQNRASALDAQIKERRAPESPRAPFVPSLVLASGLSRAETNVPQIALGSEAQIMRIEVQLEPRDNFPRFRADLHTRSGRDILVLNNLAPRRTAAGSTLPMDVPGSSLETGDYELALQGLPNGQSAQDIGYYYFHVQKR